MNVLTNKELDYIYEYSILTEKDFYPPQDNRYVRSNILNIDTNTFEQYCKDYFDYCEEWGLYE